MIMRNSRAVSIFTVLALMVVSGEATFENLQSINDLKKIDFGQSVPRHSLLLLHWFANVIHIDNNIPRLTFEPDEEEFGSHHYGNFEDMLDPLPHGYRYFTVGNLYEDASQDLPDYVLDPPVREYNGNNMDRIVFRVQETNSGLNRIDQVYLTQHFRIDDYQGTRYNPEHTYRVSPNLLQQMRSFSVQDNPRSLMELRDEFHSDLDNFELRDIQNTWGKSLACLGLLLFIVMHEKYVSNTQQHDKQCESAEQDAEEGSSTTQAQYEGHRPNHSNLPENFSPLWQEIIGQIEHHSHSEQDVTRVCTFEDPTDHEACTGRSLDENNDDTTDDFDVTRVCTFEDPTDHEACTGRSLAENNDDTTDDFDVTRVCTFEDPTDHEACISRSLAENDDDTTDDFDVTRVCTFEDPTDHEACTGRSLAENNDDTTDDFDRSIQPSTSSSGSESEQGRQETSDHTHSLQLLSRDIEAFPHQLKDITPASNLGRSLVPQPNGQSPRHTPSETTRGHPEQSPKPPQPDNLDPPNNDLEYLLCLLILIIVSLWLLSYVVCLLQLLFATCLRLTVLFQLGNAARETELPGRVAIGGYGAHLELVEKQHKVCARLYIKEHFRNWRYEFQQSWVGFYKSVDRNTYDYEWGQWQWVTKFEPCSELVEYNGSCFDYCSQMEAAAGVQARFILSQYREIARTPSLHCPNGVEITDYNMHLELTEADNKACARLYVKKSFAQWTSELAYSWVGFYTSSENGNYQYEWWQWATKFKQYDSYGDFNVFECCSNIKAAPGINARFMLGSTEKARTTLNTQTLKQCK